jgi:hypothetical protein
MSVDTFYHSQNIDLSDFLRAAEALQRKFPKSLLVSKRINLGIAEKLNFEALERGHQSARQNHRARMSTNYVGIDVFVFPQADLSADFRFHDRQSVV